MLCTHIIFHNFSIMELCHSRLCCWQKSDLVRQTVAAICYLHCDSFKNIYKYIYIYLWLLLNLWLVMVLHFLSWQKVQTIPFFSSLKCKSTRRLCKKGLGCRQRAAAYPRCCCRSAHGTAQHITCSQICCTGFLCVRVSFRIQHSYFLHIALNSSGLKHVAARSTNPNGPLELSEASLLSVLFNFLRLTLLHFKRLFMKMPQIVLNLYKHSDLVESELLFRSLDMTPTAIVWPSSPVL